MQSHLLSISDLTRAEAFQLLDTAEELRKISDGPMKKLPTLRGRTVVNLFYEDSTRTRISFESAAKRLSADVINFSAKGSSVSKGESLKDTAQTLQAMGADAVIIRHSASGAAQRLADSGWISASYKCRRWDSRTSYSGTLGCIYDSKSLPGVRLRFHRIKNRHRW